MATASSAFSIPLSSRETNSSYNSFKPGPDTPSDPATTGYFVNYLSLNTNNLTRSIEFYSQVFGLRHMFTYQLTPALSFAYMGHSQGGRNGTGYQTTAEMIRNKQMSGGLMEFVYFDTSTPGQKPLPGPDRITNTFNHVGIVVPDPEATQKRLEGFGVTIYKKLGADWPTDGPYGTPYSMGDAAGLSEESWKEIKTGMTALNMMNIFASDPDGNLLEILPQNEPPQMFS